MFAQIPLKIMRRTDLSANAKLLYARLVLFVGQNDTAWPSRETLANELGIHLESVKRAIAELANAGLIERKQRGHNRTNEYTIIDAGHICTTSTQVNDDPPSRSDMTHIKEPVKRSQKKESTRAQRGEGKKEKRGSRITEDWQPDTKTRKRCEEKTSGPFVDEQVQRFIDYWIDVPGKRAIKLAWDRAFSNWIANEILWGRFQPTGSTKPSDEERRKRRRSGLADAYSERMEGTGRCDTVH